LINNCKYGYDAQGSTLRLTIVRSSYDPDPEPDLGVQEIRYALVPHAGNWGEDVVRRAWELNNPLIVAPVDSHKGTLPSSLSLVSLDPGNLVLAAVKKAEHGPGLIVRWYESRGLETTAKLRLGFDVARAERTNVTESDNRGALPVTGRQVTVKTPAHGVVSVRVVPVSAK
jgi:alpha-mannosidase